MKVTWLFLLMTLGQHPLFSQHEHHSAQKTDALPLVTTEDVQPFIAQVQRLAEALTFIGNPLPAGISAHIQEISEQPFDDTAVKHLQEMLDPYCLAFVEINPESRVKVMEGPAKPVLMQEGWTSFLVKVHNQAQITAELVPESPNAKPVLHKSTNTDRMKPENKITTGDLQNQFTEIAMYQGRPLKKNLSGIDLEYFIIQIFTREVGKREIKLGFNVGQGTQDIGFRNTIDVLFDIAKAVKVNFEVYDFDGLPTMASFTITDGIEHFGNGEAASQAEDYRVTMASRTHWQEGLPRDGSVSFSVEPQKKLTGVFPLPSRRIAMQDEYPDFFFQPQIYRSHGEFVMLPPGKYYVNYGRGPEYKPQFTTIEVPQDEDSITVRFDLQRWIKMTELGWYSADHHIHAAGCSHYESPEEGVQPEHMWRQVLGEDLNMGNNLTWGPSWYYQKQFFTGENHQLSDDQNILRYDVEVSGFPSSHAGHIVLLNLKEDDYPNTTLIEEWPSWTLPVLQWAKDQGGITGYAHSGWGLSPIEITEEVPNYFMPRMDGIGANEFIVTVTHDVIDFYSAGDTPLPSELNMWYHVLNAGYKTRISGETDFPCISDERVGRARIYAKLDKGLDFKDYMSALLAGRSYVSDGYAHLIDFKVNDQELGVDESLLKIKKPSAVNITVKATAYLDQSQDEAGRIIANLSPYQSPYWHIERSRINKSRDVAVELIVNGEVIDEKTIAADGNWNEISFSASIDQSSWVATRVKFSAHTNPIFIEVGNQPIRLKKSIEWCRAAVDKCWEQKKGRIRPEEIDAAAAAYDFARKTYEMRMRE